MENIKGFDFFRLHFDDKGNLQQAQELSELKQHAVAATDAIFIAHGFRNDESDAAGLYTRFLETFRQHVDGPFQANLGPRKFVVAGVFWPSKKFDESPQFEGAAQSLDEDAIEKQQVKARLEDLKNTVATGEQKAELDRAIQLLDQVKNSSQAQDDFVDHVFSLLSNSDNDPTEGEENVKAKNGSELLESLAIPLRNPVKPSTDDEGGAQGLGDVFVPPNEGGTQGFGAVAGSIFGRINQFLNLTTWYTMKNRSGIVGANGVAKAVREVKAAAPGIKIHLVGHSLGGRLMAACTKSLAMAPQLRPDSLTLLEAAFSHYGFSPNNGRGQAGFFRNVVDSGVVKGPFVATFSEQDSVVGKVYAIASRLAGDNTEAIGDANDPFGGIGRNGAQKTAEAVSEKLHAVGSTYTFAPKKILCLDGSGGLIKDHSDVTNSTVTYAFACAVSNT